MKKQMLQTLGVLCLAACLFYVLVYREGSYKTVAMHQLDMENQSAIRETSGSEDDSLSNTGFQEESNGSFSWSSDLQETAEIIDRLRFTLESGRQEDFKSSSDVRRVLRHELGVLAEKLGIVKWRLEISDRLRRKIFKTLDKLQNPENCAEARKLYCYLMPGLGFGAGIQTLLWCGFNAYIRRRMLVVMVQDWEYVPEKWEDFFQPLSRSCPYSVTKTNEVIWGDWDNRTLLTSLPGDLEEELRQLGPNPLPWWYGQLLGYFLKPSSTLEQDIQKTIQHLKYDSPVVGVHIRRSDKIGKESGFFTVDEYMAQVQAYFESLSLTGRRLEEKRVFVATDDPKALAECIRRYPDYRFLYQEGTASRAENLSSRYTYEAVKETLLDVFLLARADYFIGTFSSGFSRLSFELLHYYNPSGLKNGYSLDVEFHYVGALNPPRQAIYDHVAGREKDLNVIRGDVLLQPYIHSFQEDSINGKRLDGYSWGKNQRTNLDGYFPLYKMNFMFSIVNVTET